VNSAPVRVLRVIARLNVGGPARHTVILNQGLHALGFETLLVHGTPGIAESSLEDLAHDRGVRTIHIPELGRRIHPLDDLKAFVRLFRLVRTWQPDIVHTHTAKAGAIGRLAAFLYNLGRHRSKRCAIVHTFHGHVFSGYFGAMGSLAVRLIEKALSTITDRIIAISDRQRDDLVLRFNIAPANRVRVVPLGLELGDLLQRTPDVRGMRSALGFADENFVVGFVGRLVPIKDVETLIRAAALAGEGVPSLRVVIAGDGECRGALEKVVRDLQLADRVRFVGWQRDLLALYSTFDLFVLSSLNEGTPVALIEAMAAGVPAIATSVGGVPDVLLDGGSGVLVPPHDSSALSRAMCAAIAQPQRLREMAARARAMVGGRYTAARLVEDTACVYAEVLGQKRRTVMMKPESRRISQ